MMKPHQEMRLDYHNGKRKCGYFAHSIDIDLGDGGKLTIIQESHNAKRGHVDRQAFFAGGGGGQITEYQPRSWPQRRFEPKVQIFGVDYSKKRRC